MFNLYSSHFLIVNNILNSQKNKTKQPIFFLFVGTKIIKGKKRLSKIRKENRNKQSIEFMP